MGCCPQASKKQSSRDTQSAGDEQVVALATEKALAQREIMVIGWPAIPGLQRELGANVGRQPQDSGQCMGRWPQNSGPVLREPWDQLARWRFLARGWAHSSTMFFTLMLGPLCGREPFLLQCPSKACP